MFTTNLNAVLDRLMTVNQAMDASPTPFSPRPEGRFRAPLWMPPVDIYETESAFVVEADLPGVPQENVDLQFDRHTLTISGTRAATLPTRDKNASARVFGAERLSGAFSRSIRLPQFVDADKIDATFAHGVLTVTVPKTSQAVPRKISINTSVAPAAVQP